jgi:hypothetical protein
MQYSSVHVSGGGQEILRLLRNRKGHYHAQKCPLLDPIISHLNPVYTPHTLFIYDP